MRLIVAALLVVLVSTASIRKPLPPPGLGHGGAALRSGIKDVVDSMRLVEAKLRELRVAKQQQVTERLDKLQQEAEQLLTRLGKRSLTATASDAVQQLRALSAGTTTADAGLVAFLADVKHILHQLGAVPQSHSLQETTTKESALDALLDELQALVDRYLPILAPILGIPLAEALKIKKQFDKFVADTKALEHGQVPVADGLVAMIDDILEILRLAGADITFPTDPSKTPLDNALDQLDSALHWVLDNFGPLLNLSADQIAAAEQDIDKLIADIENIEHGGIDLDAGLEQILADILNLIKDFGGQAAKTSLVETTTPESGLDRILDELQKLVDTYLPILAPILGIPELDALKIKKQFDKFVADTKALEHGQVNVGDGLVAMIDDILEILRIAGADITFPTDPSKTPLDNALDQLDSALHWVLDNLGPLLNLSADQIAAAEQDIDKLIADIENIEHGGIDLDAGLEQVLTDILNLIKDFGGQVSELTIEATTDTPSNIDKLLEQLKSLIDKYLPILGPIIGLTKEQVAAATAQFDKFVDDIEALEHKHVDTSTGLVNIATDIVEFLRAIGVDSERPTDDTPTDLDNVLAQLDAALQKALHWLGPILGLSEEQVTAIEADIDQLIAHFEDAEHGHDDIDTALERIMQDIVNILVDAGAITKPLHGFEASTDAPTPTDEILEKLRDLLDKYLPLLGPILGLTSEQIQGVITNFDKFVTDVEALEHHTVDEADGLLAMVTDIIEILRALGIDDIQPSDSTPTSLDTALEILDAALHSFLETFGEKVFGLTAEQVAAVEQDIDQLIQHFEDIEHGQIDLDGGLEQVMQDILHMLEDLGLLSEEMSDPIIKATTQAPVETTTAKSTIDVVLDELKHLVDAYLPLLGPIMGLTREQTKAIKDNFDKFVVDVEGMEHGTVEIADGVIDICVDILHILEAFDVDVTVPSTDGTTTLDTVLLWLEEGLNALLDIIGPFIGMDYDQVKQAEADMHTLINDIRALGDGHIDVDHGLEAILKDILTILGDFGVPTASQNRGVDGMLSSLTQATTQLMERLPLRADTREAVLAQLARLTGHMRAASRLQTGATSAAVQLSQELQMLARLVIGTVPALY